MTLRVHYGPEYPDALPDLSLDAVDGDLEDSEHDALMEDLRTVVSKDSYSVGVYLMRVDRARKILEWP